MKLFAVFLACIVAAQANGIPGYQYWCSQNFCVFPTPSSYCYNLPFDRSWCTAKYYADCLREYPCPDPSSENLCEAEQEDITAFVGTFRTKLEGKRCEIEDDLEKKIPTFECEVNNIHAQYLSCFKSYLARVLCTTSTEYCDKVEKYEARLAELKCDAVDKFKAEITKIIEQIKCFHEEILASFKSCLETRKCRVEAYDSSLDQKSCDVQEEYAKCMTDHMTKRKEWVICIFNTIYSDAIKTTQFTQAMDAYQGLLDSDKAWFIQEFKKKIEAAVQELKDCYRCNYKCYFNTGCYGFNRRSFRKTIKSLPAPPKYDYKLVRVGLFNPEWEGCPAPEPETKDEEKETFVEKPYLDCIDAAYKKYLEDLCAKIEEWKGKVETWKCDTDTILQDRISCMKPKSFCGKEPTESEIQSYQQKLRGYAATWLSNHECTFIGQIDSLDSQWKCRIESWKSQSNSYISKVKAQFDCCIANKCSKTSEYECILDQKICRLREQLNKKLQSMLLCHKELFESFYQCSFGCNVTVELIKTLKSDYITCIEGKVETLLEKFDQFWCDEKPKYLTNYECGFKCTPKVSVPGLRTNWEWSLCAPSTSSFFSRYCY